MTDKEREIIEKCEISDILDIKGKEDIINNPKTIDDIELYFILFIYDSSLNSNNSISLSSRFLRSLSRSSIVNTLSTS